MEDEYDGLILETYSLVNTICHFYLDVCSLLCLFIKDTIKLLTINISRPKDISIAKIGPYFDSIIATYSKTYGESTLNLNLIYNKFIIFLPLIDIFFDLYSLIISILIQLFFLHFYTLS